MTRDLFGTDAPPPPPRPAPVDDAALRAAILRDVTDAGAMGWTVPECATRHGLRIAQAYRQLDRLAKAGLIRRGGVRSVDGRPSVAFVAVAHDDAR